MPRIKKHVQQESVDIAPRRRRSKAFDRVEVEYPAQRRTVAGLDVSIEMSHQKVMNSERRMEIDMAEASARGKITRCLENVELARQRMANDQIEIDRLRMETRALISEMMP